MYAIWPISAGSGIIDREGRCYSVYNGTGAAPSPGCVDTYGGDVDHGFCVNTSDTGGGAMYPQWLVLSAVASTRYPLADEVLGAPVRRMWWAADSDRGLRQGQGAISDDR